MQNTAAHQGLRLNEAVLELVEVAEVLQYGGKKRHLQQRAHSLSRTIAASVGMRAPSRDGAPLPLALALAVWSEGGVGAHERREVRRQVLGEGPIEYAKVFERGDRFELSGEGGGRETTVHPIACTHAGRRGPGTLSFVIRAPI